MDIAVPSRFACLKIEDDDFRPSKPADQKKKDKQTVKKVVNKQQQPIKKNNKQPAEKKTKKKNVSENQWQEWKERDHEFVDGNFEQDLKNAILLSKLDYEEKKDVYSQAEKEANGKKKTNSNSNKKKKNKAMSLNQFLTNKDNNNCSGDAKVNSVDSDKFFERMQMEIKEELTKEKVMEKCKERQANIEEIITIAQCQEKLKLEQIKNKKLEKELEEAKKEIKLVKERNKKLCGILGYGEMKDKADVLIEVERLNTVKDELTEEVRRLHELLEQERSKGTNSTTDNMHNNKHKEHKEKKNKKHAT